MLEIITQWQQAECFRIAAVFPKEGSAAEYTRSIGVETIIGHYRQCRFPVRQSMLRKMYSVSVGGLRMVQSFCNARASLLQAVKQFDADVFYTNTSAIYTGYWISKMLRKPHIWQIREFGLEDQDAAHWGGEKFFLHMLNASAAVIFISQALRSKFQNSIGKGKQYTVYNDINPQNIDDADKDYQTGTVRIVSCGTLIENKGHMQCIQAVVKCRQAGYAVELQIAGTVNTRHSKALMRQVRESGAQEYITFLGHVKDMKQVRSKAQIAVVASYLEAFGRVTVESMLSNLAVIGSNSGATCELITDGVTGLLYPRGDVDALCDRIMRLCDDRALMKTLAQGGRAYAGRFARGDAARQIAGIIHQVES